MNYMKVKMIAATEFKKWHARETTDNVWSAEGNTSQDLTEFAGRACYQSWERPNPATADNKSYLQHIIDVGHESVLEHGSVTFYIEGVSRSLTHELIRHRHGSYSQLSQRFVVLDGEGYVVPPLFRGNSKAIELLDGAWDDAITAYNGLLDLAESTNVSKKQAREAARAVLPNMTPTAIVMTGNHRTWREVIVKRASLAADMEIAELFVEIYRQLSEAEPNLYLDLHLMNTGERRWVCGCNPHGHNTYVIHDVDEN